MTSTPNGPQLTTQDANAWLLEVAERHADIHIKAAHSWHGPHLYEAFAAMSVLFLDAFEEVRVMSTQLREESQTTRSRASALHERSAQLLERSTAARERLAPFLPPTPEERHAAESQILDIYKNGLQRKDERE